MTDYYDTSVGYTFTENEQVISGRGLPAQPREIDYGFRTPWRFIGSGGLVIPNLGLLSAEVEYVNYAGSQYNLDKDGNSGAEYMIERFLVRAGYNWLGAARIERGESRSRISLGGGFRADQYYLDFAYVRGSTKSTYTPYDLQNDAAEQQVDRTLNSNRILFTLGYRF